MRILLMWPSNKPETDILIRGLQKAGHELCYWVGEHGAEKYAPAGTLFHDHYDAWAAKPAPGFPAELVLPPSAETLASLIGTESLVLTMMNKRYDTSPVDERKQIYYDMVGYWIAVLENLRPDVVIFNSVPHSIYTNIVYDLARKQGLRTLCFEDTWVARRLLTYENFWEGSSELKTAVHNLPGDSVTQEDLGEELREYLGTHFLGQDDQAKVPPYMSFQRNLAEGWGLARHRWRVLLRSLKKGSWIGLMGTYLRRLMERDLKDEYRSVVRPADLNSSFVYFPLSFQPERTTSPQGGVYVNQILAVETIAAALPSGWEVYVKEHPSQWWLRTKERYSSARYRGYYKRLSQIPHVRIIPVTTNTFTLTEKCQAIAVITGTAGWEAILRGKLPLVFGYPWYRDFPGIFQVRSVSDCENALKFAARGTPITRATLLSFLKAFERGSIRAYIEDPLEKKPRYTPEENMTTITEHICELLATA